MKFCAVAVGMASGRPLTQMTSLPSPPPIFLLKLRRAEDRRRRLVVDDALLFCDMTLSSLLLTGLSLAAAASKECLPAPTQPQEPLFVAQKENCSFDKQGKTVKCTTTKVSRHVTRQCPWLLGECFHETKQLSWHVHSAGPLNINHNVQNFHTVQQSFDNNNEEVVVVKAEHACLVSKMTAYLAQYPRQGSLHGMQLS